MAIFNSYVSLPEGKCLPYGTYEVTKLNGHSGTVRKKTNKQTRKGLGSSGAEHVFENL
jgi:hypothetical protein